jgi:putative ABC transport system permease protein
MVRMRQLTLLRTTPEMPTPMPAPPPFDGRQLPQSPDTRVVSRDFLKAMGVRLIAGRMFGEADGAGQPQVMLINRTLARSGFLGTDPIGTQIYAQGCAPWQIVGIVEGVRQFNLDQDPDRKSSSTIVRNRHRPHRPRRSVRRPRRTLRSAPMPTRSRSRGIFAPSSASSNRRQPSTTSRRWSSWCRTRCRALVCMPCCSEFAGVAVTLTAVGIYGVMAYSVTRRTREIGIRMALGAQRRQVIRLVLGQSLLVAALGIGTGIGGAIVGTRYLGNMLFGLTPLDPATFIAVSMMFAAIATLAAFVPARRATRVDPLVALRYE